MDLTKDKELVRAYKKEVQELLRVIRKSVTNLQKGRDKKTVYRLFRSCHTLMEISGCMGLKDIEKIAGELLEITRAMM